VGYGDALGTVARFNFVAVVCIDLECVEKSRGTQEAARPDTRPGVGFRHVEKLGVVFDEVF
jgi:hypothetical protein